ncbi:unnamed protein product [Rotaria sp. Silwood1]|nr:unnamed protein product [Rotaria sp. Silwood1]CAF1634643.1 unnamed protein product [Rotaria sp. Silwood1]
MRAIELSILSIQRAIEVLDLSSLPSTQPLIIADFDLSHGFNSIWAKPSLRETLERNNHRLKEEVETLLDQFWNLYE